MDKICIYELVDKNYSDGIIKSRRQEFNTLFEPFPSVGTMFHFVYQWKIPSWIQFEKDLIWDMKRIDCIIPTASQMLVEVILFHRNYRNIDIYVSNLKDDLWFAKNNGIEIFVYP